MMLVLIQRVYIDALWLIVTCGLPLDTVNSDLVLVCPDGWHKHNTQCYWFSDFKATRDDAKIECEARNSSLVTVSTSNINNFLQQHISNNTNYWIGLKIDGITNTFKWQWSSGQKVLSSHYRFIDWCNGHSVGTVCAAAAYSNIEPHICYESYNCGTKQRYVCEKEKLQMSSCPDGWDEHTNGDYSAKCYYISVRGLSNMDAAEFCWSQGARLITVTYNGPNRYLRINSPGPHEVYWIGLSPFKWDDITPYNWNNWDTDGPNIGAQCTLLQQDGTWHHEICSEELHNIICQQGATMVQLTTTSTPVMATITSNEIYSPEITLFIGSDTTVQTSSVSMISETSPQTTVNSAYSSISANELRHTENPLENNTPAFNENTLLVIIGILSAVTVCFMIAVVALAVYIRRRPQITQQLTSPQQETPYEDVLSAAYYNVPAKVNVQSPSVVDGNRDDNVHEKNQIGLPDCTYEELTKGPYVNNYKQPTTAGTYATLDHC